MERVYLFLEEEHTVRVWGVDNRARMSGQIDMSIGPSGFYAIPRESSYTMPENKF